MIPTLATSVQFSSDDYNKLKSVIENKGVAPVMVTLDSTIALTDIKDHFIYIKEEMNKKADRLFIELGISSVPTGYWNNGIGQIGFYVDSEELENLVKSDEAHSFILDTTRASRIRAYTSDGSLELVEQEILRNGFTNAEIFLNLDNIDYDIEKDKVIYYGGQEIPEKVQRRMDILLPKLSAESQLNSTRSENKPSFKTKIDLKTFYDLRESDDVRAIHPLKFKDSRKTQWPSEALSSKESSDADVIITLRGGEFYTSKTGSMSENAAKAQEKANQKAFDNILIGSGIDKQPAHIKSYPELASFQIKLSHSELRKLIEDSDPRILSVELNKPAANAFLSQSMGLINMQSAWNAGFTSAGQNIVVIDTGVRTNHVMLTNRIGFEACFGTNSVSNGILYNSICPSANGVGDSPLGLVGSAAPHNNAATCLATNNCSHGTHVSGIAAGRSSAALALQGVSPNANIIPVQVFSYGNKVSGAFNGDILAALVAVRDNTVAGTNQNPFVVNMSLGGSLLFAADCSSYSVAVTNAIQDLTARGIPVVTATGNNSNKNQIAWPACVPHTIKVGAVADNGSSLTSFTNIGVPASYTGPILTAPGYTIESAGIANTTDTDVYSGTSQATPHVAGIYAALKAAVPGISVADSTAWIVTTGSIGFTYTLPAPTGRQTYRRINMPNF